MDRFDLRFPSDERWSLPRYLLSRRTGVETTATIRSQLMDTAQAKYALLNLKHEESVEAAVAGAAAPSDAAETSVPGAEGSGERRSRFVSQRVTLSGRTRERSLEAETPSRQLYDFVPTVGDALVRSLAVVHSLSGHKGCVNSIELSEDASMLLTGSDDRHVCIFDTQTAARVARTKTWHRANIFSAVFMPYANNDVVLSAGLDGAVVWTNVAQEVSAPVGDSSLGMSTKVIALPQWGGGHVGLVSFEAGEAHFIDCRSKTVVHKMITFRKTTGRLCINSMAAHPRDPNIVAFAVDGPAALLFDVRYVADKSPDAYKPNGAFAEIAPATSRFLPRGIGGVGFSQSGDRILINYKDDNLYSVDWLRYISVPENVRRSCASADTVPVLSSMQPPGDTYTLSKSRGYAETAAAEDAAAAESLVRSYVGRSNRVTMFKEATFCFDDQYVATGSDNGMIYVWNADTSRLVHRTTCDRDVVNGVLASPKLPTMLFTCGIGRSAKIIAPAGDCWSINMKSGAPRSPSNFDVAFSSMIASFNAPGGLRFVRRRHDPSSAHQEAATSDSEASGSDDGGQFEDDSSDGDGDDDEVEGEWVEVASGEEDEEVDFEEGSGDDEEGTELDDDDEIYDEEDDEDEDDDEDDEEDEESGDHPVVDAHGENADDDADSDTTSTSGSSSTPDSDNAQNVA